MLAAIAMNQIQGVGRCKGDWCRTVLEEAAQGDRDATEMQSGMDHGPLSPYPLRPS